MRYIKPPDFKSVRELQEYYRRVETDITKLLTDDASARTADELNGKLSLAINAAVQYLTKVNNDYVKKELPTAFKEGQDSVTEPMKLSAKEAADILARQGFKYAKNGFSRDTYIELQTATRKAGNGLKSRVNKIIDNLSKTGNDSVYSVQQAILKDLGQNDLMYVEYANGARQPLHSYAAMAARSARIESTNIGAIGRALQAGTDYVKMTTMPQCCRLCGAYQDKVYSISGQDKRFPALFKTVLQSGYALPHPNCRHEFIPWFIELEDPADVDKAIKRSKIKYDSKGNLVDVRYQADIKAYAAWQAGNRQLNRELQEYEQMQAYYKSKDEDAPYKSLGAFRRARRAQAESYKVNRKEWGEKPQVNRQNPLTNSDNSGILQESIPLPDETLPRSLGAKWMNYDILMPDGTIGHFQEGSKLHHKEVFAGKGCKRKIDQIDMLVSNFGGDKNEWQKVKAIGTIVSANGETQEEEVHWYQEPTVGWVLLKVKVK